MVSLRSERMTRAPASAKDFAAAQGISVTQAYKDLGFSKNNLLRF